MPDVAAERLRGASVLPNAAVQRHPAGLRAGIPSEGGPEPALASVEVFQTDDRYASPVLKNRYQVLASAIGTTFYVYDLHRADQVRTEAKDIRRFEKKSEAFAYLGFTSDEMRSMFLISAQDAENTEKEFEMANARVVTEAMAKAQASMEKRIAAKKAAAIEEQKDMKKAAVKKAAAPKAEKVKTAPKVEKSAKAAPELPKTAGARGVRQGTVGALTRELILAGKDNAAVIAGLQTAFPDKANSASNVNWYRNALRKEGVLARPGK